MPKTQTLNFKAKNVKKEAKFLRFGGKETYSKKNNWSESKKKQNYIATTSLIQAIIKPQVKDSNAVYIYKRISTNIIRESTSNRSIVNCQMRPIFYKQLNEEPSRDQHEAKWNIPTVR